MSFKFTRKNFEIIKDVYVSYGTLSVSWLMRKFGITFLGATRVKEKAMKKLKRREKMHEALGIF